MADDVRFWFKLLWKHSMPNTSKTGFYSSDLFLYKKFSGDMTLFQRCILVDVVSTSKNVVSTSINQRSINVVYKRWMNTNHATLFPLWINVGSVTLSFGFFSKICSFNVHIHTPTLHVIFNIRSIQIWSETILVSIWWYNHTKVLDIRRFYTPYTDDD